MSRIDSAAELHSDRLWDEICREEEEARAAEEMGMTVQQLRDHIERERGETAIDAFECDRIFQD
jgi:hypothetical protein